MLQRVLGYSFANEVYLPWRDVGDLWRVTTEGVVLRMSRGGCTVQTPHQIVHCVLRGNLKKQLQFTTSKSSSRRVTRVRRVYPRDVVAPGDRVRVTIQHHGAGVIEEVLPRTSCYSRTGFRGRQDTVVCNIQLIAIVFACAEPNPDVWKLDRFLLAAETEELEPLIVANKCDLAEPAAFREFEAIGYRVLATSTKTGHGIPELRDAIQGKLSAFVGPSGVGKSSLLNAIQPGLGLRTAETGTVTHKGRHTTTTAQLIPLHVGGWVADTPGLRQFEILDLEPEEVAEGFVEFRPYLGQCRFDDCRHASEPDCAVKQAVEEGRISRRRYESYLTIIGALSV